MQPWLWVRNSKLKGFILPALIERPCMTITFMNRYSFCCFRFIELLSYFHLTLIIKTYTLRFEKNSTLIVPT